MSISLSGSTGTTTLGIDTRSAEALRASAVRDPKGAIHAAARQFEALFMQQLMKSMRDATLASGMLDNSGTQMGTEMLDAQFATQMSGLKGGLGDAIARQLERQMAGVVLDPAAERSLAPPPAAAAAGAVGAGSSPAALPRQADFVRQHQDTAREVERLSGIPAAFMVGQAAHESGWGRKEIRLADGSSSHNLFGIKAGPGWTGPVAEVTTTEYIQGTPRKVTARFRAYESYAESFQDYARLLQSSPRYAGVISTLAADGTSPERFAQGLQRAGYATDPAYADKLTRVINTTLRMQRALG